MLEMLLTVARFCASRAAGPLGGVTRCGHLGHVRIFLGISWVFGGHLGGHLDRLGIFLGIFWVFGGHLGGHLGRLGWPSWSCGPFCPPIDLAVCGGLGEFPKKSG